MRKKHPGLLGWLHVVTLPTSSCLFSYTSYFPFLFFQLWLYASRRFFITSSLRLVGEPQTDLLPYSLHEPNVLTMQLSVACQRGLWGFVDVANLERKIARIERFGKLEFGRWTQYLSDL